MRTCNNCGGDIDNHPWPESGPYLRGCVEELKRQIDELRSGGHMPQSIEIEEAQRRFAESIAQHHQRQVLWNEEWYLTAEARQAVLDGKQPVMTRSAVERVFEIHRELALDNWRITFSTLTVFGVQVKVVE
jgi:hypothetical protein